MAVKKKGNRARLVGGQLHERETSMHRNPGGVAWLAQCSCGRMKPVTGSASSAANAWHGHVEREAEQANVSVEKPEPVPPKPVKSPRKFTPAEIAERLEHRRAVMLAVQRGDRL